VKRGLQAARTFAVLVVRGRVSTVLPVALSTCKAFNSSDCLRCCRCLWSAQPVGRTWWSSRGCGRSGPAGAAGLIWSSFQAKLALRLWCLVLVPCLPPGF